MDYRWLVHGVYGLIGCLLVYQLQKDYSHKYSIINHGEIGVLNQLSYRERGHHAVVINPGNGEPPVSFIGECSPATSDHQRVTTCHGYFMKFKHKQ